MATTAFNGDKYLLKHILELKRKYGIKVFLELGTYKADTTIVMSDHFKEVHSIECNKEYFDYSYNRCHAKANVVLYNGDSPSVMARICGMFSEKQPVLIFEDCHWYAVVVFKELQVLKDKGLTRSILVIHDIQNPNDPTMGYDTYGDVVYRFETFKPHIDNLYGINGYNYYFNDKAEGARRGALFVIPKSLKSK